MSIPIFEACKKRKRIPKLYGLHSFADPRCPIALSGPFRDNIRVFLQECAELEDYNVEGMPIWCTLLVHENRGFVVSFYTIEESRVPSILWGRSAINADALVRLEFYSHWLFDFSIGFLFLVFGSVYECGRARVTVDSSVLDYMQD